jgi:hypothetical protein
MSPPFFLVFVDDVKNQDIRIPSLNQQIHPEDLMFRLTPKFVAKIADNIHLMVDAGIWDGFVLRGSLAMRL